jgi:hypothetical protein
MIVKLEQLPAGACRMRPTVGAQRRFCTEAAQLGPLWRAKSLEDTSQYPALRVLCIISSGIWKDRRVCGHACELMQVREMRPFDLQDQVYALTRFGGPRDRVRHIETEARRCRDWSKWYGTGTYRDVSLGGERV